MIRIVCLSLAAIVVAWNAYSWADIPPPPAKNEPVRVVAPLSIVHGALRGEGRSIQAKIRIPKHLVHAHGEAGRGPAPELAPPPRGAPAAPREKDRSSLPPYGTIIAGLAMSLAAVSVVFIARGNRNSKTVAMAVLAGALVLGAYGVANADLIPGRPRGPVPPPPEIVIELVDEGEEVTLFIVR